VFLKPFIYLFAIASVSLPAIAYSQDIEVRAGDVRVTVLVVRKELTSLLKKPDKFLALVGLVPILVLLRLLVINSSIGEVTLVI
jgi:uncharacterized membrane protein YfhO